MLTSLFLPERKFVLQLNANMCNFVHKYGYLGVVNIEEGWV